MQDNITAALVNEQTKYSYDYEEIKEIVYNFDFEETNDVFGSNYTSESFLAEAITNIDTFVPYTRIQTRATACNENFELSGWNYVKMFASVKQTNLNVLNYRSMADSLETTGSITGLATISVPILATLLVAATYLGATYYKNLANDTEYTNTLANCGTVTTVNRFLFTYTVKSQWRYEF